MKKVFEIAVIGGGSAGTMSMLRAVLNNNETLFFKGNAKNQKKSRAKWVRKVENIPGHFDFEKGIENPNEQTLEWIKNSPLKHKLHLKENSSVIKLEKENNVFTITTDTEEIFYASFVILCTGIMDVQPVIGGSIRPILPYANRQMANYCLRCDGHHVIDKDVSVIGHNDSAAWVAIMLHERYAPQSISVISHDQQFNLSSEVETLLKKYNIKKYQSEIVEIIGQPKEFKMDGFKLLEDIFIASQICFISLGIIAHNELALQLGAHVDSRGLVVTNAQGETNISGLYVAGDLRANAKKQIYTAWDHSVESADAINAILRKNNR